MCNPSKKLINGKIIKTRTAPYPPDGPIICRDCKIGGAGWDYYNCDKIHCFQFGAPLELCPCFAEKELMAQKETLK